MFLNDSNKVFINTINYMTYHSRALRGQFTEAIARDLLPIFDLEKCDSIRFDIRSIMERVHGFLMEMGHFAIRPLLAYLLDVRPPLPKFLASPFSRLSISLSHREEAKICSGVRSPWTICYMPYQRIPGSSSSSHSSLGMGLS